MRRAVAVGIGALAMSACRSAPTGGATVDARGNELVRAIEADASFAKSVRARDRLSLAGDALGVITGELAVRVGTRASTSVTISATRDRAVRVEVAPLGLADVPVELVDGVATFADAAPDTDVLWLARAGGLEEVRRLRGPRAPRVARYRVELGPGLARLRVRDGRVQAVDESGRVRLATTEVFAVDARGTRRALRVVASDDRTFATELDAEGLAWPVLVDPVWVAGATMPGGQRQQVAVSLPDGRVLVVGSENNGAYVYDPKSDAWTDLSGTTSGFSGQLPTTGALLPNGKVLVTGYQFNVSGAQLFDPATNTFSNVTPPAAHRMFASTSILASGKVLVAGGEGNGLIQSTSEIFDPATSTWSPGPTMTQPRRSHTAVALPDGRIVAIGGDPNAMTAEVLDAAATTWTPTPPTCEWTYGGSAIALLPTGKIFACFESISCLYDPATNTWSTGTPPPLSAWHRTMTILGSGLGLLAGGATPTSAGDVQHAEAYLYDPAADAWTQTASLATARSWHASTFLANGDVLVTGGFDGASYLRSVELYSPGTAATGSKCKVDGECATNHCVDGFCCDGACNGTCVACAAAKKTSGTGDGACGPAIVGTDPHATCTDDGAATCGQNGLCDGAGACQHYATSSGCSPMACAGDAECTSGHCVEGICCDSACTSLCDSCLAARKGPTGRNGVCEPLPAGSNARGGCTPDVGYPANCRADGTCDGAGSCRQFAVAGTTCGSVSCSAGKLTAARCDGSGVCASSSIDCAPFVCSSSTTCGSSCTSDAQCEAGVAYCRIADGTCQPLAAVGASCGRDGECALGHCVDGVCCDTSCTGTCVACVASKKGAGVDGQCGNVASGTDPDGECPDDGAASCQRSGSCDGKGGCALYAPGTSCAAASCVGNASTASRCDGVGACAAGASLDCGAFACVAGACRTSCASDADCVAAAFCDAGVCKTKKTDGASCGDAHVCASGFCVDGVCCAAPCDGQCEACDVAGAKGACVPVAGAPHGARTTCGAASPTDPCAQATCDGIDRTACRGFATSAVVCQAAGCKDGVATLEARCDGRGHCPIDGATKTCEPFACGADACKSACTTDADCASSYHCDATSGKCIAAGQCDGDHTVRSADGTRTTDCSPFKCESGGTCKTSCGSTDDCVGGLVCDEGRCVAAATSASNASGGCAHARGGADAGASSALLAIAAGLALARTRRRRASVSAGSR